MMDIQAIISGLLPENHCYCILHGWHSLPEGLTSDLDIVAVPESLCAFERTLLHSEYGEIVQLLHYAASSFYFVLAMRDENGPRFVPLDTSTDYRAKGFVFFSPDELLLERQLWNGFWIASPEVEFKYLLVKKVIKGAIPEYQKGRLKHLLQELGEKAQQVAVNLFGPEWGKRVVFWIHEESWNALEANLSGLKRALLWQRVKQDPLNPFRYWIPELKRIWLRWRYPTGLFIAVLGPDGVGKSTLVNHLQTRLLSAFRRTAVFHFRPGLLRRKDSGAPVSDPHGRPSRPWPFSTAKILYYALDYVIGYLLRVRPKLVKSTLVFFDRYYDDLLVDPLRYRYGGPPWLAHLARRFIPRPDLFLILDVPEDELRARKQEVSRQELRRQRNAYRKLASELPNAVLLDGSLPEGELARRASGVILDYLHERYLQRRHIWFGKDHWESLGWLSSVLSADREQVGLAWKGSSEHRGDPSLGETNGVFRWLTLPNGRSYLIPAESRRAALALYNAQSSIARAGKKMLSAGLKAGLAGLLLPKVRLLTCRDSPHKQRGADLLLEHLREILGCPDLTSAISLGTPGPHRKPVIQLMSRDGQVLGYVKVGWNGATNALVCNEVEVLRKLNDLPIGFQVPRIVYAGEWQGRFLGLQSAPGSQPAPPPRGFARPYVEAIKALSELHIRRQALERSAFWARLSKRAGETQHTYYGPVLQDGMRCLGEQLDGRALPFHWCHGDFAPWNAHLVDGKLFLFDWEYADQEAPAGYDLFHFLVQTLWLFERRTPGEIHEAVVSKINEPAIGAYWDDLGVERDSVPALYLFFLLERLAFWISQEPHNFERLQRLTMLVTLCLHDGGLRR